MWIAMTDGFFSIVEHKEDTGKLLVRARLRGNLEHVFGVAMKREGVGVSVDEGTDYRFRTVLSRASVVAVIASELSGLDYTNFKGSVDNTRLGNMYGQIWNVGYDHQTREAEKEG